MIVIIIILYGLLKQGSLYRQIKAENTHYNRKVGCHTSGSALPSYHGFEVVLYSTSMLYNLGNLRLNEALMPPFKSNKSGEIYHSKHIIQCIY